MCRNANIILCKCLLQEECQSCHPISKCLKYRLNLYLTIKCSLDILEGKNTSPAILCILVVYNLSTLGLGVIFHYANQTSRWGGQQQKLKTTRCYCPDCS